MHLNSELLFKKYAKRYFRDGLRVLEVGPDKFPSTYAAIVDNKAIIWETVDMCNDKQLSHTAKNEYRFAIPDDTFDIVLSGQVIEHVRKIWVWTKELSRVCKKNGKVITIAPASWSYHEAPVDCWRIYPEGMSALYEEAGLAMDLCTMESLEYPGHRRIIPGVTSWEFSAEKFNAKNLIKRIIGWPITAAYDTIAVGTKVK
jgi:SAM-dependent methyltransferase